MLVFALLLGVYMFMIVIFSWWIGIFIIKKYPSLSLVTVFVLNFFSDISVVTQTLLVTMCMEYVFSNLLFSSSLYL